MRDHGADRAPAPTRPVEQLTGLSGSDREPGKQYGVKEDCSHSRPFTTRLADRTHKGYNRLIMGTPRRSPVSNMGGALFGATRQAVLGLLFGHTDRRFYQRQIIRSLGFGSGAVQRELEHLVNAGIVIRTVEGRQTYFQSNREWPAFRELRGLVPKPLAWRKFCRKSFPASGAGLGWRSFTARSRPGAKRRQAMWTLWSSARQIALDDVGFRPLPGPNRHLGGR